MGTASRSRIALMVAMAFGLAGCAAAPAASVSSTGAPTNVAPPPLDTRGLKAVLNRSDDELVALFGAPRLDVVEGAARKLQFSGKNCVLDVYLYPPENGGERKSTYVDARDRQGGAADRASCANALRR
ncbi:MAG: hypothetical protein AAGH53_05825 [Pseudomonadota bacterium]